jgi:hypothetical protein
LLRIGAKSISTLTMCKTVSMVTQFSGQKFTDKAISLDPAVQLSLGPRTWPTGIQSKRYYFSSQYLRASFQHQSLNSLAPNA